MPELTPVVEPTTPAAPVVSPAAAPTTAPEAPPEDTEAGLPDELLQIPAIQAVVAGSPPAVSMKIEGAGERPEVKLIAENKDPLLQAGFAFYRSMSGDLGVLFNQMKIHAEDIKAADKAGKLRLVAPDFDLVNHEVSKLGPNHPVNTATPGQDFAQPTSAGAPQAASGSLPLMPPAPASVQRRLAQQRVMNLSGGAPTSGPAPGAGRLLNSILKPVV